MGAKLKLDFFNETSAGALYTRQQGTLEVSDRNNKIKTTNCAIKVLARHSKRMRARNFKARFLGVC